MAARARRGYASAASRRPVLASLAAALAAVAASAVLLRSRAQEEGVFVSASARPSTGSRGHTAVHATVTDITKSRLSSFGKGEYIGRVDSKLRALTQTTEYARIVKLLVKLNEEGKLKEFVKKCEDYWKGMDINGLMREEEEGRGPGVLNTVRNDWEKLWPKDMGDARQVFSLFAGFWRRFEQSRIFDEVMKDTLPGQGWKGQYATAAADSERLGTLDDDEARDEMIRRMSKSKLVNQYAALVEDDEEVQSLAPDMISLAGAMVATLERKSASKTIEVGLLPNLAVGLVAVVSFFLVITFLGGVKLPFSGDPDLPQYSKPTLVLPE